MGNLIALLTLRYFIVSSKRKRSFVLSVVLLLTLLLLRFFHITVVSNVPYTSEIFKIVVLTLTVNIFVNMIRLIVVSSHRKRHNISSEERDNFTVGVNALVNAATTLSAVAFIFLVFDIEFRAFLNSIALFAVALTIIFQDFIKNFLFGLAIMFSDDYQIGDYIQVGEMQKGVIVNITFSSVRLKTESGDLLYIPNTIIRSHEVLNLSKLKPKRINAEFKVLRSQLTTIEKFEKALFKYLEQQFTGVLEIEKSHILIKESNKDEVSFSFEAPSKKASLKLREDVNRAIQKFAVEYSI
jgi:small-conductance mechanosensitive channel